MSRFISKSELAAEYGIHRVTLMLWIKNNQKLLDKLTKAGYIATQKVFTPQQVTIIRKFLSG